ncbi:MAG: DUF2029 domain-containing protein, partial [Solirubrobacterales bacterium]|nr:DUF2029 domain-containing protein [Solirubrobacterales bacterium]
SVPVGFRTSAAQAMHAAEHTRTMEALHRHMHPLQVYPFVWRAVHPYWYVVFEYRNRIVGSASVSSSGRVLGAWTGVQATATYAHGGWSWSLTSWMVLVPGALLFLLPFLDPERLRRLALLDALASLVFLASWLLLANEHLEAAVWTAYPPILYLLGRLLRNGFRPHASSGRLAPLLSLRTLLIGLPLLLMARVILSLIAHQEIDVGYESVIGAYRVLHHLPLYYNDPNHGDTYWPVTYLAYVPFQLMFPWVNSLSSLRAAHVAAIAFDLGTVVGLVLLGRQLRRGSEGTRLGLILAWAWAACPFTTIALVVHTNDSLASMLTVFAMVALRSPIRSGALVGLAAAAKFSPAGLLPLLAAPRQRGIRGARLYVAGFAGLVALPIALWLPPGGLSYFWQRTIEFQIHRYDVFSPWALHASLRPVQTILEAFAVLLAASLALFPRERTLPQVCALAAAVTLAIQLPATHWYYYYIVWFLPFALVAFLARPEPVTESVAEGPREWAIQPPDPEPTLVAA